MRIRLNPDNPDIYCYKDLTPGNVYRVIGMEAGAFRIMCDVGQPYLFPKILFQVVDASTPLDWIVKHEDSGERFAYGPPLNAPGFFERYFGGDRRTIGRFKIYLTKWLDGMD